MRSALPSDAVWESSFCSAGGAFFPFFLFLPLLVVLGACGSSTSTSVVGPSAGKCAVSLTASATTFPSSGGSGSVIVATERECSWRATSDSSWITLGSPASGVGSATLAFSVRLNPDGASRSGFLTVNDQKLHIAEEAAPCQFRLERQGQTVQASGGAGSVNLDAPSGCGWSASSTAAWLSVENRSGSGSGAVRFSAAKNTGPARQGTILVAGAQFTVAQLGTADGPAPPGPTPPPSPGPPAPPPAPPAPAPPQPRPVRIEGELFGVSGSCPVLSFLIEGPVDPLSALAKTHVTTSSSTAFDGRACADLRTRDKARVTGTMGGDGRVTASRVEFLQR